MVNTITQTVKLTHLIFCLFVFLNLCGEKVCHSLVGFQLGEGLHHNSGHVTSLCVD